MSNNQEAVDTTVLSVKKEIESEQPTIAQPIKQEYTKIETTNAKVDPELVEVPVVKEKQESSIEVVADAGGAEDAEDQAADFIKTQNQQQQDKEDEAEVKKEETNFNAGADTTEKQPQPQQSEIGEDEDLEEAENGEDEMNEDEEGEEELEEEGQQSEADFTNLRRKVSMNEGMLKKQMSVQLVRGGIMGNEGFIGEDGAIEKSENDDDDDDDNELSKDGMRTRQSRIKYRKKTSTDKNEVISRTRQGAQNTRQSDDNIAKVTKKVETTKASGTINSTTKKTVKPVAAKAATKSSKPIQAQNSSSSGNNGSSQLSQHDSIKIVDIKTNNSNQRALYRDSLIKFLYRPQTPLPDLADYTQKFIEVRVHKAYVSRQNKAVRHRLIWGCDQYTSDSDAVCIMQHTGQLRVPDYETDDTNFEGYSVVFKVMRSRQQYPSQSRNQIRSRKKSNYEGHSLKLESICKLDWLGSDEELLALARKMPTEIDTQLSRRAQKSHMKAQIALSRATDSIYRALSDAKVFNLSLESATKYNLCRFVDRSLSERTSDKLRSNVLYFETPKARYELARFTNEDYEANYRLAEVKDPYFKDDAFFNAQETVPLSVEPDIGHVSQVIADNLSWNEFQWGIDSLKLKSGGVEVIIGPIINFMFRPSRGGTKAINFQARLKQAIAPPDASSGEQEESKVAEQGEGE